MKKPGAIIFLMLAGLYAQAEVLLYRSDMYDKPNGTPAFYLEAGSEIYCYPSDGGWTKSVAFLYITADQMGDSRKLKRGTALHDQSGKLVGKLYQNITYDGIYRYSGDNILLEFECYIPLGRVDSNSFIERRVTDLLNAYNSKLKLDSAREHIADNGYVEKQYDKGIITYTYFEKNRYNQRDDYRLKLVFYQGYCAAVVLKRKLKLKLFEAEVEEEGYRVVYLRVLTQQEKNQLQGTFKND